MSSPKTEMSDLVGGDSVTGGPKGRAAPTICTGPGAPSWMRSANSESIAVPALSRWWFPSLTTGSR